ncbi:MAG TPA: bifunctional 4-hydroxy-2-oxoglutarate aldolase/2-dehydro-3-deoxy-phosphogluconate aldolase [Vicinamibacterales bacterium]|jgi:2-dehydro-3-deoxyphosphogluconate aldolase / (4S)-4-hydroxy-2-oxoglutarate aldolase|nr:bifunctional 4-hydroxy-2-oxoglutarate aldolase/2-dehydro-3-deoxy-phosphogluconate aldolase [Vicinamibacterales bacterium]
MTARRDVVAAIEEAGVIAMVRIKAAERVHAVVDAVMAGGVRALEVTMTVPSAIDLIRELAAMLPSDFMLGAGAVLDEDTASRVIEGGARFVSSSVLRPELIDVCHDGGALAIPGCFSPTEIMTAWEAGADFVRLFPAASLGCSFITDVKAALPSVKLIPTGGVSVENAGDWIRAGASAVGVGSALLDRDAIGVGYETIVDNARRIVAAIKAARASL